ncbi:MAG: ankyrin repeat domain-containing protein [Acidobacteria bacterium]|nr:ankyrin repeat domain-containing protein [Acidobacteriota bacterium]
MTKTKRALSPVALLLASLALIWAPLRASDLHEAVKQGDVKAVEGMLQAKPDRLNQRDAYDRTPLFQAALSRQPAVFDLLLSAGADVNLPDREGFTPLHLAAFLGQDGWVGALLDRGAVMDTQTNVFGYAPLHAAARGGHLKCAERLLAKGVRLNLRDAEGNTPLALAATYGRGEMVGLLLSSGASPRDEDLAGSTPLHLAALAGCRDCVDRLLAGGAAVDPKNAYGNTPFQVAVREGQTAVAQALSAAGAKEGPAAPPPPGRPYLGQKRPGTTPVLFAPGIVSTERRELNSVFTPDGREFYFTIRTPKGQWRIMVMKRRGGRWTLPETASFSGVYSDADLFFSPDGRKLWFCSNRPRTGQGDAEKDYDIWAAERAGDGWSQPVNLGPPVNSREDEFYPTVSRDGTLYFQTTRADSRGVRDLYCARFVDGAFLEPENLGDAVNSREMESDALVSPGGEWIVFSVNRPGGRGQGDLYLSRRDRSGSWSAPVNLGDRVNSAANENCPALSPDGKYLFFTRGGDIYWADARVLDQKGE